MEKQKCPEIRFIGFSGDWVQSNLAECTDLLTGNPFNSKEFTSSGIFLVRGMNVKRGYLDTSTNLSEYWPSSKGLEHYLLEPEDIVIQMDGALIGKSYAKVNSNNLPALLVQRVARVRSNNVEIEFIYQYIHRDFLRHISGIKTETAVPHLSLNDIRDFTIFLPEKQEQTGIGNFFQNLDQSIALQEKKITQTQNLKKAMLEKMFPKAGSNQPEVRLKGFSGDWEENILKELSSVQMCKRIFKSETKEKGEIPFYKIGTFGGIPDAFISQVLYDEYQQKYPYPEVLDILISASGTIGRTVIYNGEKAYYQDSNIIWLKIDKSKLSNKFLVYFYEIAKWNNIEGSTIKRLYNSDILSTVITFPSLKEQNAIGNFFKQLDETLALQQQRLQTLKNLKRAFLEKMFV